MKNPRGTKPNRGTRRSRRRRRPKRAAGRGSRDGNLTNPTTLSNLTMMEVDEIESLRAEIERSAAASPPRWNVDPEDARRSVAKLVLTLVEFLRKLMERQAIRRMEAGTLSSEEIEAVGLALMRLEETLGDIGARFGLTPEDLNLDLGPLGRLI